MIGTLTGSFYSGMRPSLSANAAPPLSSISISIWYDGADINYFVPTNPASGANISNWNDKSGNGHNAAPTGGANKPQYVTNEQNGKSIVRFYASDNLNTPATYTRSQTAFGLYAVARMSTSAVSGVRTITATDTNGYKIFFNGTNWAVQAASCSATSTITADASKFHIHGLLFDSSQPTTATQLQYRYDLSAVNLTYANTPNLSTNASTNNFDIGWWENGASPTKEYFDGDIAEICLFTRKLTTPEITFVESYLKNKWGL